MQKKSHYKRLFLQYCAFGLIVMREPECWIGRGRV